MCCYRCTTPLVTEASRRRQNQRVSNPFLVQHTAYQPSQVDNYVWAIFRIRASQIGQVRVGSEALHRGWATLVARQRKDALQRLTWVCIPSQRIAAIHYRSPTRCSAFEYVPPCSYGVVTTHVNQIQPTRKLHLSFRVGGRLSFYK